VLDRQAMLDKPVKQCTCAWAHHCKRKRKLGTTVCEDECTCCVCSFRRTTLCADGDFEVKKTALAAHLRHLVMTGQREDASREVAAVLAAEVRGASSLLGAGCRAIDDDMGEDDEETEWAEAYVRQQLPPGPLATAATEAVAHAASSRPDPIALVAGMSHLRCSACDSPAAKRPKQHEVEPVDEGVNDDESDVLILREDTFEQQQEAKLAQAKQDDRYIELSSDEEECDRAAAPPAPRPTWQRHLIGQPPSPKAPSPRRGAAGSGGSDGPRAAAARAAEARAAAARAAADAQAPAVARPRPTPFDLEQQLIQESIQAERMRAEREGEREREAAAAERQMAATMAAAAAAAAASAEAQQDWRAAAVARLPDPRLDALAAQAPAAGGCGSWWGRAAAEEMLGGDPTCALCSGPLDELPRVPGVEWVQDVDANGDIICCGTVAVGEMVSLLAVSPPCGHAVHQLCARSELRRLNARPPGTSGVASPGLPEAAQCGPAACLEEPPCGAALLWRCPRAGCPTPAA